MYQLTPPERKLGFIASFLGLIQGITWTFLSLLCIIEYLKAVPPNENPKTYMEYFQLEVYLRFLYSKTDFPEDAIITSLAFTVFMWLYLVFSLCWVVVSVLQLLAIRNNENNLSDLVRFWGLLTTLISFLDLMLVVTIANDFNHECFKDFTNSDQERVYEMVCTNTMVPVMVIAARGFVLWIVNVIFVYEMYQIFKKLQSK